MESKAAAASEASGSSSTSAPLRLRPRLDGPGGRPRRFCTDMVIFSYSSSLNASPNLPPLRLLAGLRNASAPSKSSVFLAGRAGDHVPRTAVSTLSTLTNSLAFAEPFCTMTLDDGAPPSPPSSFTMFGIAAPASLGVLLSSCGALCNGVPSLLFVGVILSGVVAPLADFAPRDAGVEAPASASVVTSSSSLSNPSSDEPSSSSSPFSDPIASSCARSNSMPLAPFGSSPYPPRARA